MSAMEAEVRDERAAKVGYALSVVADDLRVLFSDINFDPVFEPNEEEERALTRLQHVSNLVGIAADLYPYPFGDEDA